PLEVPATPRPRLLPCTTLFRSGSGAGGDQCCSRFLLSLVKPGGGSVVAASRSSVFEAMASGSAGSAVCDEGPRVPGRIAVAGALDRKSTRLNSSHVKSSYAVFC